jgi:hypothetical protein
LALLVEFDAVTDASSLLLLLLSLEASVSVTLLLLVLVAVAVATASEEDVGVSAPHGGFSDDGVVASAVISVMVVAITNESRGSEAGAVASEW